MMKFHKWWTDKEVQWTSSVKPLHKKLQALKKWLMKDFAPQYCSFKNAKTRIPAKKTQRDVKLLLTKEKLLKTKNDVALKSSG